MRIRRVVSGGAISALMMSGSAFAQHITTFEYDALGRLVRVDRPGDADRHYVYDAAGNLLEMNGPEPNYPPTAVNDTGTIQGTGQNAGFNLIANDTDANSGDTLTVTLLTGSLSNASASINAQGTGVDVTSSSVGTSSLTYTVEDDDGASDTATFTLTVTAGNQAPTAVADNVTVPGVGQSIFVLLTGNDTDPENDTLEVTSVSISSNATAVINGAKTGATFTGTASGSTLYSYTISDGNGNSATVVSSLEVDGGGGCGPFGCGGGGP